MKKGVSILMGCLLFLIAINACATGAVRDSPQVYQDFRSLTVHTDYAFWYFNQENNPFAVMGLKRPWHIKDILWKPVAADAPTFAKVVDLVGNFPVPGSNTYGATIVDEKGNPIGVWYSSLIPGVIVDHDTNSISISITRNWRR